MARQPDSPASRRSADVLSFPAHEADDDLLVDRLRGSDRTLTPETIADWADPLDAAILAACLLHRPVAEIRRREEAADRVGHVRVVTFWHEARMLLLAITAPAGARR